MTRPRPSFLLANRGFSLVGVLTGLAILGVTSAATIAMIEQGNRSAKQLGIKFDSLSITRAIVDELSTQATCTANLDRTKTISNGQTHYDLVLRLPNVGPIQGIPFGEVDGPYSQLPDYQMTVQRFWLDGVMNTGLKGIHNLDLYQGDVMIELRPYQSRQVALNLPALTRLYLEVDGSGAVQFCSTGDDPTLALAMACYKVSGFFNEATLGCDMTALHNQIVNDTRAQVTTLLQGDYYNYLLSAADQKIAAAAGQVQAQASYAAAQYTDGLASQLNSMISVNTQNTNYDITQVNNALTTNVNNLWNAMAGVNALSQAAANTSGQANATSANANATSNAANGYSNTANFYSNSAIGLSSSSNGVANQANQTSNAANQTAASANNTSASANNGTNNANANSNAAMNAANAANNLSNAANGASSSAINYANTANAWTNQANATANQSLDWANQAVQEASSANNWVIAGVGVSNNANTYSWASINRPSTVNTYVSGVTRVCNYSPVPCSQQ